MGLARPILGCPRRQEKEEEEGLRFEPVSLVVPWALSVRLGLGGLLGRLDPLCQFLRDPVDLPLQALQAAQVDRAYWLDPKSI